MSQKHMRKSIGCENADSVAGGGSGDDNEAGAVGVVGDGVRAAVGMQVDARTQVWIFLATLQRVKGECCGGCCRCCQTFR